MEPTYDTTQTDQSVALQSLLGGSDTSLIPESLVTLLTISFVVLNILGLLFFIFYVFSLIRKWKVQTAVLEMRKDIAEIKASLAKPAPVVTPPPEKPQIAQEESSEHIA